MFGRRSSVSVDNEDKLNEYISGERLVVVDFYSTDCYTCKQLEPKFNENCKKYDKAKFIKVNIDELDVGKRFGVTTVPSFQFFKKGERLFDISGAKAKEFEQACKELLAQE